MLETNGECELPCWWGVVPGQADWQTVKGQFIAIGGFVFEIPHPERLFDYYVDLSFKHGNGVVESITVASEVFRGAPSEQFVRDWHRYSLDQVLNRYGIPSQVRLHVVPEIEPGAPVYYNLALAYDHLGFYINYEGPALYEPPVMRVCPRLEDVTRIFLKLQAPRPGESVLELPKEYPFPTVEEAAGMDVETFYEIFKEPGTRECLETPAEMWP